LLVNPIYILVTVVLLFILILPINMFWYSLGVLALLRRSWRAVIDNAIVSGPHLRRRTIIAATLITLILALFGIEDIEPFWMTETQDSLPGMLALVAISSALVSLLVVRLKTIPSALMAAGMTLVNLAQTVVVAGVFDRGDSRDNPAPAVVTYGIACAVLSVLILWMIGRSNPKNVPAGEATEDQAQKPG
jgi:hypothetical protein